MSVWLAVTGVAASGSMVAAESSRRAAAATTHEAGDSVGTVGEFPPNGSNTSLIRFTVTFGAWTGLGAEVAGCAVATAVDELATELADVDDEPFDVDTSSLPADDDSSLPADEDPPAGVLDEDLSLLSGEEPVTVFKDDGLEVAVSAGDCD